MEVSPNEGLRVYRRKFRFRRVLPTRPPIWPATPTRTSSPVIPKEKCQQIVKRPPNKHYVKSPLCVLLSESQKLDRLKDVGGYNPWYVAVNRQQAQKFVSLVKDVEPLTTKRPSYSQLNKTAFAGDEGRRSGNTLPSFAGTTTIQECFVAGSLLDGGGFRRLCTECFAITQLETGVFPPFINEVICGQNSDFCVPGIGECQQKVLRFTFLRFTGNFEFDDELSDLVGVDTYVEQLETFDEDIRACCECRAFASIGKK